MAFQTARIFYPALALSVGPSPSTGYHFITGFNNVYTGSNSGTNLIQNFQRMQSITDDFQIARQNINQLGQLAIVSREITTPPTVKLGGSYYVTDAYNDQLLGLYVSGNLTALTNILNGTQADKNYFVSIAPQGIDNVNWTGNKQAMLVSNGYLSSWSTEGAVGNIPTTTFAVEGFNWATYTGSTNQPLNAINITNGNPVQGINFTLPTVPSGLSDTVSALRPIDITLNLNNAAIGIDLTDVKIQSYNISFDLALESLNQLGSLYPYARQPKFPVTLSASVTAYWGNLLSGSLRNVLCADSPYTLGVYLNKPCGGGTGVNFGLNGMYIDGQSFGAQDIGAVASTTTLNFSTQIGGPSDLAHGLTISGLTT